MSVLLAIALACFVAALLRGYWVYKHRSNPAKVHACGAHTIVAVIEFICGIVCLVAQW